MSRKSAKDYLNQAYRIDTRIASKMEQVGLLIPTPSSIIVSDDTVQSSPNLHGFEDKMIKYIEAKRKLEDEIADLIQIRQDIDKTIKRLNNTDERLVLELRYLCFNPWQDIADKMGFCQSHMFRIYEKALESVDKVLEGKQ